MQKLYWLSAFIYIAIFNIIPKAIAQSTVNDSELKDTELNPDRT